MLQMLLPVLEAVGMAGMQGAADIYSAKEQESFQSEMQGRSFDFAERMANTQHQREIADLKAAGLNPILSSKYGGNAAPVVSAASMSQPNINLASSFQSSSAAQLNRAYAITQKKQQDLLDAQKQQTDADTLVKGLTAQKLGYESMTAKSISRQEEVMAEIAEAGLWSEKKTAGIKPWTGLLGALGDSGFNFKDIMRRRR